MKKIMRRIRSKLIEQSGVEMVQAAILIAIAIILGLIFKTEITSFVNKTFDSLNGGF
ncbi:MAG: Flp1 family type IVb pilin [Bacilli bacterium]